MRFSDDWALCSPRNGDASARDRSAFPGAAGRLARVPDEMGLHASEGRGPLVLDGWRLSSMVGADLTDVNRN